MNLILLGLFRYNLLQIQLRDETLCLEKQMVGQHMTMELIVNNFSLQLKEELK